MVNNVSEVKIKSKLKKLPDKNFVIVDDRYNILLNGLVRATKEECGGRPITFNEMVHKITDSVDEVKLFNWLDMVKKAHKGGDLTPQFKQKISRILKGGIEK